MNRAMGLKVTTATVLALCGLVALCLAFAGAQPAYAAKVAKPAKVQISSVTSPAASKAKVQVKKAARAKGYQYRISTNKASTKGVKTKTSTKRTVTFTGLQGGKKYYVKVRAYRKPGAKKIYGAWSNVRAITVKKATKTVKTLVATVKLRDYGSFDMRLYPDYAPITVDNFTELANSKFYDGLTFHRMVEGFCLQGGDPAHNGTGGSAQTIFGEFYYNGYDGNPLALQFQRGVVAMARSSNDYNSASSQFFVTLQTSDHNSQSLNGQYAAFGYVDATGMKVVDKAVAACVGSTDSNGLITDYEKQPVIESIRVKTVSKIVAA